MAPTGAMSDELALMHDKPVVPNDYKTIIFTFKATNLDVKTVTKVQVVAPAWIRCKLPQKNNNSLWIQAIVDVYTGR